MAVLAELLPVWGQVVVGAAALVTSAGILWRGVLNPIRKAAGRIEDAVPVLLLAADTFAATPLLIKTTQAMAAQFDTDGGSSLRDVTNRIEEMVAEAAKTAQAVANQASLLSVGVEAAKQLSERDRQEVQRLFLHLDRVSTKVDTGLAAIAQIQTQAGLVATDLASSHARATAVVDGQPGEAADAASKEEPKP